MRFVGAEIPGVWLIEIDQLVDRRGFFGRAYCDAEFERHGLHTSYPQCNISYNASRGTLRGMHYQNQPAAEVKIVRCTAGAVFDVVVDLRPDSPAYCRWQGFELSAQNRTAVYIPQGCAHGFQTLTDDAELFYMMGAPYSAAHASGVRWNDPAFGIRWPVSDPLLSDKDRLYPDYKP
jgi:dTDP-4-dehydrorhamnose 3,5-epimerase